MSLSALAKALGCPKLPDPQVFSRGSLGAPETSGSRGLGGREPRGARNLRIQMFWPGGALARPKSPDPKVFVGGSLGRPKLLQRFLIGVLHV